MHPCRQPAESSGVGGLAASVVAGGGAREAGCVGRGGPRRRSVAGSWLRNGTGRRRIDHGAESRRVAVRAASRPGVPAQWLKPVMGLVASAARGGVGSGGRYDSAEPVPL